MHRNSTYVLQSAKLKEKCKKEENGRMISPVVSVAGKMSELSDSLKLSGTAKKDKRDTLPGSLVTPRPSLSAGMSALRTAKTGRHSIFAVKRTNSNNSLHIEPLRKIEENQSNLLFDNYQRECISFVTRRVQNRLLIRDKKTKLNDMKKCLVSLKLEFAEQLDTNTQLQRDLIFANIYEENIEKFNHQISKAKAVLDVLKETKFHIMLDNITRSMESYVNQLELVDFKEEVLKTAFHEDILGHNSELFKLLQKVNDYIKDHKETISQTATEVSEIWDIHDANQLLKKRCDQIATAVLSELVEANYKRFFEAATNNLSASKANLQESSFQLCSGIKSLQSSSILDEAESSLIHGILPYSDSKAIGKPHSSSTPQIS